MKRAGKFTTLQLKAGQGSLEALAEIQELLGPDQDGRILPIYVCAHRAIIQMRDRLRRMPAGERSLDL